MTSAIPQNSSSWVLLEAELSEWHSLGRRPRFWWRDDDAVAWTLSLERLVSVTDKQSLCLAVIPAEVEASLSTALATHHAVEVLMHGWSHTNHEPKGQKGSEFGINRSLTDIAKDCARGHARLTEVFGERYVPVFVPPWNRIAPGAAKTVCEAGLLGISAYQDRKPDQPVHYLNTHADVLDWRVKKQTGKAGFIGTDTVVTSLRDAFRRRRLAASGTDSEEPVGLLTHHLQHDEATWDFLDELSDFLRRQKNVVWTSARQEFKR